MHPDPCFHPEDRDRCRALVEQVGFAMIFAATPDGPKVVHAPVVWTGDAVLQFHISRRNALAPHLDDGAALCVVNGPNAYISPRWYSNPRQVPTWNYVAVELEGRVRQLDEAALRRQLASLIETSEARVADQVTWTLDQAPVEDVEAMIPEIVCFELEVQVWRPTFKLSQNKPASERARVAQALETNGAGAMARMMRDVPA
jgi:transcriptional regulator